MPPESVRSATELNIRENLVSAALSATCRMVVPVFVLFMAGLLVDAYLGQMAFYAIIGAVLGFVVAGWLIYKQLKGYQKKSPELKEKN